MNERGGFSGAHHHLDPTAQEFFPTTTTTIPTTTLPPQIFYHQPYAPPPPPPPPPMYDVNMGYPLRPPQFHSLTPPALDPPQPVPPTLPPPTTTPSRTLLLSMVPTTASESTVRRELEVFGDVRAVQMERLREGLVTVYFYDVRDAHAALVAIQDQHMQHQFRLGRHYDAVVMMGGYGVVVPPPPPPQTARGLVSGRVVWAQFATPVTSGLPDGNNQGTLVVFNLDAGVSAAYLRDVFEAFGPVKELRETPNKRNQRFVEFYDVRNAAAAMAAMNGKEIYGKSVVIEFSRPGGQYCKKLWNKGPQNGAAGCSSANKLNNCPTNSSNYSSNIRMASSPYNSPPLSRTTPSPPSSFTGRSQYYNHHHSRGNPSGGSGGSKSSSSGSSFHGSVSNLCINSSGGYDNSECSSFRLSSNKKKSNGGGSKKSHSSTSGSGCSRPWKGGGGGARHGKEHDPRFLINEDDAIMESDCKDPRTTVMIKNIPNKYSQKLLLNMLDNHCIHCNEQIIADGGDDQPLSSYDFVYLPIDFINKCNVGYGFVNMTSPEATLRLYKAFHHQNWEVFNSRKICQVTYARLQGLEALREHFKNSKFPGDAEEYMPVVFSPPRDGLTLTDPTPIFGSLLNDSPPPPASPPSSTTSCSKENQPEPPLDGVVVLNGHIINDATRSDDEEESQNIS